MGRRGAIIVPGVTEYSIPVGFTGTTSRVTQGLLEVVSPVEVNMVIVNVEFIRI